jgi:hypothetical protein
MSLTNTLAVLLEKSRGFDLLKHDHKVAARDVSFDSLARITLPTPVGLPLTPLTLRKWSLDQIASKLGPAVFGKGSGKRLPVDYLLAMPDDLRGEVLTRHCQDANGRSWLVRGYENEARAVLDGDYPVIRNTDLLETITEIVAAEVASFPNMRLVAPHVDGDDLHVKIMWRGVATPDGIYGLGVYVGNGETGQRKVRFIPAIQRSSCDNSILMRNDDRIEIVHRGSLASRRIQIAAAMQNLFSAGAELISKMIESYGRSLPTFRDTVHGLAIRYGWADEFTDAVFAGSENSHSVAGVVNGVSSAAKELDPHERIEREIFAGRLLDAPAGLFTNAARLARRKAHGLDGDDDRVDLDMVEGQAQRELFHETRQGR